MTGIKSWIYRIRKSLRLRHRWTDHYWLSISYWGAKTGFTTHRRYHVKLSREDKEKFDTFYFNEIAMRPYVRKLQGSFLYTLTPQFRHRRHRYLNLNQLIETVARDWEEFYGNPANGKGAVRLG